MFKYKAFDLLMKHFSEVCEPYEYEKENATTGNIEVVRKLTDCISEERSIMRFVKQFITSKENAGKE